MEIIEYNDYASVDEAKKKNEPLMAVIAFDGSKAYVCHLDDGVEHHILLMKNGYADWTFICPPDYKGIPYRDKRIKEFYRDGIRTISEFLSEFGYLCDIQIPKRYKRHFDAMLEE